MTGRTTPGARRLTPLHAALAVTMLGLLVMPFALAGAQGPEASSSAPSAKKVKKQVKKLKKRVAALEETTTATGPAGGDLAGTYPNPQIGPNAVGSAEVAPDSLVGADIAPDAVGATEIAANAVGGSELADNSVGSGEFINGSLHGADLSDNIVARAADISVANGQTREQTASCLAGEEVISGGAFWITGIANDADLSLVEIQVLSGTEQVTARGQNDSGITETLQVQAYCLN